MSAEAGGWASRRVATSLFDRGFRDSGAMYKSHFGNVRLAGALRHENDSAHVLGEVPGGSHCPEWQNVPASRLGANGRMLKVAPAVWPCPHMSASDIRSRICGAQGNPSRSWGRPHGTSIGI